MAKFSLIKATKPPLPLIWALKRSTTTVVRSSWRFTLTNQWQRYTLDLGEKELIRIKSGVLWNLTGQGEPVEFFLDDIQYR